MKKDRFRIFLSFDAALWLILAAALVIPYLKVIPNFTKIAVIVISVGGALPVFFSALKALKNKKITIDLLASIALGASLIGKQWTSAIFIDLMITSARIFADYTESRSRRAIEGLLKLKPQKAKIKKGEEIIRVPLEKVKKGDLVLVELGEMIPVDGTVEKGEAEIDQSALTGESMLVSKKAGDLVLSSTVVASGNLMIKVEKIGEETTFEKIIQLVENSQKNKAPISALSAKFSIWYIILTLFGSLGLYLISQNFNLVLAVLLVSCADDVAIAIPLAFLSSIAHSARHGVIIKGGNFLEALAKAKVMITDKTGTLTRGKLKVENIFAFVGKTEREVAEIAGALALFSNHPSSQAIVRYLKGKKLAINEPENFKEYAGKGATAYYKNTEVASGKIGFFKELNIKIDDGQLQAIAKEREKGFSAIPIGEGGEAIGFIVLADEVKHGTKEVISEVKKLGIEKIVMLTGDNEKTAARVAEAVDIKEFYADLLPEDKINHLKKYLKKDYKTIMVGDGVNDAAALALADVGIAMGTIGSDAAIEAADIALMRDDLRQVPELIKIGKSTMKVVKQDLLIWGAVNIVGLVLVFGKILGPNGAAAYNFFTDFLPLINSMRLFKDLS